MEPSRFNGLAVAVLASSIALMPLLGWAKLSLGKQLACGATAGEGTQNLLCAVQGAVGLAGLLLASAGAGFLDAVAALIIAGISAKAGAELWRGEECGCHSMPGLQTSATDTPRTRTASAADGPRPRRLPARPRQATTRPAAGTLVIRTASVPTPAHAANEVPDDAEHQGGALAA